MAIVTRFGYYEQSAWTLWLVGGGHPRYAPKTTNPSFGPGFRRPRGTFLCSSPRDESDTARLMSRIVWATYCAKGQAGRDLSLHTSPTEGIASLAFTLLELD